MMKIILDTFPVFSTLNPWDDDIDSSKESKIMFIFCPKTFLDINQRRNFSTEEVWVSYVCGVFLRIFYLYFEL